eukprot:jgi/Ulvmu1/7489/UM037_0033.1
MLSLLRDEMLSVSKSAANSNASDPHAMDTAGIQLDLSNSKITSSMVSNMLCGWHCCHTITLANNSIGDEATSQLCRSFYSLQKPSLRQLSLAYNCLTDASAEDLAKLIAGCTSMDALDIEGNMLSVKGIQKLAQATGPSHISSLYLSHNTGDSARLDGSWWREAFQSGRLKTLEIAQHFPDAAQADLESLVSAASGCKRLTCLDVRGAVFHRASTKPVLTLLQRCTGLKELRVSVSCQQDKAHLLLGAARVNPRCLVVVAAPSTGDTCENSLAGREMDSAAELHSPQELECAACDNDRAGTALVPLLHGNAVAPPVRRSRRARSSTAGTSLASSKQGRRSFKHCSGLYKGSSAGGAAQRGAQVFMRADRRGTGSAKLKDLSKAFRAFKVDGFSSKKLVEVFQLEAKAIHKVDDATMTLQEFLMLYDRVERGLQRYLRDCRIAVSHGPQKVPKSWASSPCLPKVFAKFCNHGRHRNLLKDSEYEQMSMSYTQWVKLMDEMSVTEPIGPMGRTSADMVFAARAGAARKLSYAQFLQALLGITGETGWTHHHIHAQADALVPAPRRARQRC